MSSSDSDSGPDDRNTKSKAKKGKEPESKKRKHEDSKKAKAKPQASSDGDEEEKFDLGGKRFISVTSFKKMPKVDIREFYEKDGELLPGRKGVSLTEDQWENLKGFIEKVDEKLEAVK